LRYEPRRPLLAKTGGQQAPLAGREVDGGNLGGAALSRDAVDLCQLTHLCFVEKEVLAVA